MFFIFGTVAISFLDDADLGIVLYAALSLTLVRMVPVALALAGMGFRPGTIAFMGWFGPRGLASIILALVVAEEEPVLPALGVILAGMTGTVLASVALHGLSAVPLVRATRARSSDCRRARPSCGARSGSRRRGPSCATLDCGRWLTRRRPGQGWCCSKAASS